jgi:hypothetical protein
MTGKNKFKGAFLALLVASTLAGCGLDGDDGEQGATGQDGPQGQPGLPGADGADGQNGNDASLGLSMAVIGRAVLSNEGAAEIVQYHGATQTVYATNGDNNTIQLIPIGGLTSDTLSDPITANTLGFATVTLPSDVEGTAIGDITSIAVSGDLLAAAVTGESDQDNGFILFFNGVNSQAPVFLDAVEVGALPDMVTFTPDGSRVLAALEGEPSDDYTIDPLGGIAVIDILANGQPEESGDIVTFEAFNGRQAELEAMGMHFPNPSGRTINGVAINTTVAQDLEPEYITTTNATAYVSLQENNGIAILDLETMEVDVVGLGFKDWAGLDIDVQEDGSVSFGQYEGLFGVYQPDTISHFEWNGATFLVTANEGDAREYIFDATDEASCLAAGGLDFDDGECLAYTDEVQIEDLDAEPGSLFEAILNTGEADDLRVTMELGDADGDGEYDTAFTYGARSFTIWDQNGLPVYDSGDDFERITASIFGDQFNNNDDENEGDSRSENKGPEPEAITVGTIGSRTYAFVGLERMGGIMVYDVTNPFGVFFVEYVNNRDVTEGLDISLAGDLAPESIVFVDAADSPTSEPIVIVGSEVSGSVTVFGVTLN